MRATLVWAASILAAPVPTEATSLRTVLVLNTLDELAASTGPAVRTDLGKVLLQAEIIFTDVEALSLDHGWSREQAGPLREAGVDIVTWLEDGSRTGTLDATVTDEDAYTVQWTVVSEPNEGTAVIEIPDAEDTAITLTDLGEYVLQLEASDGEYAGSDTVTINVYSDSCEATKSLPNYVPLVGDLNGDCRVDEADMALLEENWLKCNALGCTDRDHIHGE